MKIRIKRGEFWLVNTVISLTAIVWFVTSLMYVNAFEPEEVRVIIAGCIVVLLLMIGIMLYMWLKKVNMRRESEDERSDRCSLKATRNAFIVALLFLAIGMILRQMNPDSVYHTQPLHAIFGVSVASYTASYFYYRYFG